MSKKETQRDRVREHLKEYGSITRDYAVYTMRPGINRLSERIRELKAEGMNLSDAVHIEGTADFRYSLLDWEKPPKMVPVYGPSGIRYVPEAYALEHGLTRAD